MCEEFLSYPNKPTYLVRFAVQDIPDDTIKQMLTDASDFDEFTEMLEGQLDPLDQRTLDSLLSWAIARIDFRYLADHYWSERETYWGITDEEEEEGEEE